jgi:hypothetical protein
MNMWMVLNVLRANLEHFLDPEVTNVSVVLPVRNQGMNNAKVALKERLEMGLYVIHALHISFLLRIKRLALVVLRVRRIRLAVMMVNV